MPERHATVELPWQDGATLHGVAVALPWQDGATVHGQMSAYSPGSPPAGGISTQPQPVTPGSAIAAASSYDVVHTVTVTDLRDSTLLPVDELSIDTDEDSVYWTLRASGGAALYGQLTQGALPAVVGVVVDGLAWEFVIDAVSRSSSFAQQGVSFNGRSASVLAGAPYAAEQNWVNDGESTAAQIASVAQVFTGLAITWKLTDWLVPDKVFSHSGTPLSVVMRVAEAVGAIVQSERTGLGVKVLSRYPWLPNEWPLVPPDVALAWQAIFSESFDLQDRPEYDGVHVSGQQQGALAFVRREGTAGAMLHPLVTDLLLTEAPALRERGEAILGASGKQARVTLTLPVLTGAGEPGVLDVGQLVRVDDPAGIWFGLVRAVSLRVGFPSVTQQVVVERHLQPLGGTVAAPSTLTPLVFDGPIPALGSIQGAAESLDLAGYWSGGEAPYALSLRRGSLPAGLGFAPGSSVVTGTPSALGATTGIELRAVDGVSNMADSNAFTWTVYAALAFAGPIADQLLTVGVAFSLDVSGEWSGGVPPLIYSVASGTLPTGIALDANTGVLSGSPSVDGSFDDVVIRATDQNGNTEDSNAVDMTVDLSVPLATIVAVAQTGTNRAMTSTDGISWTARPLTTARQWVAVAEGGGQWVACQMVGSAPYIATSPDGLTWTDRTALAGTWVALAYGAGLWVAVATTGDPRIMTSPDGITWTYRSAPTLQTWQAVIFAAGQFVVVGTSTTAVLTSPDGINWTQRTGSAAQTWRGLAYGAGLFVAVAEGSGTARAMTSADGISWTNRTTGSVGLNSVCYGAGLFVGVGRFGQAISSADGITWVERTPPEANAWRSVTYRNGLFIAVASTGTNRVMTSPDGITWTARAAAEANQWYGVT